MRRLGRTGKPDANHAEIVDALRRMGWFVISTSGMGHGCPDAFAAKGGRLLALEIKDGRRPPSARKLTEAERKTHEGMERAGCQVIVIESVEHAKLLGCISAPDAGHR